MRPSVNASVAGNHKRRIRQRTGQDTGRDNCRHLDSHVVYCMDVPLKGRPMLGLLFWLQLAN